MGNTPSAPPPPPVPEPLFAPAAFIEPIVAQWAAGLFLLHLVLQKSIGGKNAGLLAHQVCVFIPFMYSATRGSQLLFFDEGVAALTAGTYADRLYGFLPATWEMTQFFLGFQIYDLCATLLEPSLRKFEHLMHHGLSLLTALAGLSGPLLQYYCPFFFGFVEVSSVPLCLVDVFRAVPPRAGSFLGAVNEVSRIVFAVSFLAIRGIGFPYWQYSVLCDLAAAYRADDVRGPLALGWFAFSGTVLCGLQLFWAFKIIRILAKQFSGNMIDRSKEA